MDSDSDRFKTLLKENLSFPNLYIHKFIGPNSAEFRAATLEFEKKFTGLNRTGEKQSSTEETHKIPGILYIL